MPRLNKMTPIKELDEESIEMPTHIRLNKIIKEKDARKYKLAEHLGVKQGTVSNWALGRTPLPSCYVYDICMYLDITPNELFGWGVFDR